MNLSKLLHLIEDMPEYRQLLAELKEPNGETKAVALEAAKPYLIAALYQSLRRPMVVVSAQPEKCQKLYEQIAAWSNSGSLKFPEPDALPRVLP